ncbi:hypothetical protein KUCAC02_015067 [Chaenocephalus aceratus]|uniref:Uncharacterized protein n=1 Tax=Chaenocephalus aceratus TaxID=36190 RepID=A0ACB9XW93_CHAAC|nr:hypothetical protein KUCAC02_015067 [Chaenocephalus aceratus]
MIMFGCCLAPSLCRPANSKTSSMSCSAIRGIPRSGIPRLGSSLPRSQDYPRTLPQSCHLNWGVFHHRC